MKKFNLNKKIGAAGPNKENNGNNLM